MGDKIIEVIKVKALDNYHVIIKFKDGVVKDYDASTLLKLKSCQVLNDIEFFKRRCCIINGTLAGALTEPVDEYNCIDLDPREVYKNGVDIRLEDLDK
ncbi:hypothetical protein JCM1393_20060 [Clostridium carnis]